MTFVSVIKTIIVDDEPKARNTLLQLIELHCPQIEVVDMADSSDSAYTKILEHQPQLLFLDIEISNEQSPETSFDLLDRLPDRNFEVIFVTAFDKYAVQAFQFSAIGYLLKPFGIEDLIQTVKRAEHNLSKKNLGNRLEDLLSKVQEKPNHRSRVWIHSQNEIVPVPLDQIIYIEAQGKYTLFCCKEDKQILSSKNLGEFVDMFEDNGFVKVHRSYIINPQMILKFDKKDGGSLIMSCGTQVPVSRVARKKLLEME